MSNEALRLADSIHEMNNAAYLTAIANLNEKNRQQAERIAELEKEGASLKEVMSFGAWSEYLACKAERDQLRAEVERLMADAERYRWLRDNLESEWAICEWQDDPDGLGYYRDARAPEFVDAAIDHALTTHKDEASC